MKNLEEHFIISINCAVTHYQNLEEVRSSFEVPKKIKKCNSKFLKIANIFKKLLKFVKNLEEHFIISINCAVTHYQNLEEVRSSLTLEAGENLKKTISKKNLKIAIFLNCLY